MEFHKWQLNFLGRKSWIIRENGQVKVLSISPSSPWVLCVLEYHLSRVTILSAKTEESNRHTALIIYPKSLLGDLHSSLEGYFE